MEASLARPSFSLSAAALKFGDRMQAPLEQFRKCMQLASDFTSVDKPTVRQKEALDAQLTIIDDVFEAVPTTDILYHHLHAMSTASAAITCVAADHPMEQLQHIVDDGQQSIEELKQMNDASHTELADAVEKVLAAVRQYVEKHCAQPIPVSADPAPSPTAVIDDKPAAGALSSRDVSTHTAVHLVDYRANVIDGAAKSFLTAASKLGGSAEDQAKNVFGAVDAVYDYLVTASQIPSAPDDDKKQTMLEPIIKFMSAAGEKGSECPTSDPHFNHVKASEEAVNMVSWIVASEKPTTFVTDADGSASFYLNKILMSTKKQPDAADHKAFVDTLKALFTASKSFIKEHYTMGLRYGTGVAAVTGVVGQKKEITSEPVEATDDANYLTAFKELITGPLAKFVEASKVLGGEVEEQSKAFAAAWEAEADFLAKAICTPKPDDYQDMLAPIATEMGKVGTVTEKCGPRGTFTNHCSAVGESVAVLGWVAVDEKAVSFVGDSIDAGQFYLNKVKMGAKSTSNPDAHRAWAAALESLYKDLKAYVKEHHTQKLVWNPPKRAKTAPRSTLPGDEDDGDSAKDYVTAFKELLTGPLAAFVEASKKIGGEVETQSKSLAAAWEAEAEFLAKAIGMPKPDDIQDLLAPIAGKMGEVAEVTNQISPRASLANHCNSVSESVSALGWVAVDEKPVSFIGDMIGAGQFYLNKVKTNAKNTDDAESHRLWATALESLYADLKAYVKEYHTQKLVWNVPKGRKSFGSSSHEVTTASTSSDYVADFRNLISGPLAEFSQCSQAIGGEVERQAKVFVEAWEAEAEFLEKAIKMPKPADYQDMLGPIATKMGAVNAFNEEINPRDPLANHCNAVGEYVAALGWVAVEEKATLFVGDMAGAGEFYLHKVKMGAKQSDDPENHRKWASSIDQLFKDLKLYVKQHHTQRLTWNKA